MPPVHNNPDLYQPTREEWDQLRADVTEIKTALTGNNMGTKGVIARLLELETWRDEARLKLALIAAGIAGGATTVWEIIKGWAGGGGHGQ